MLKKIFLPLLAFFVIAAVGWAAWKWRASHVPYTVEEAVPVKHYVLQNGLELVVIPNHRIPAVTQMLWVKAGGGDDPENMPGLAHFLEHMMFTGTPNYPEGAFDDMVERLGGTHNAFTSYDFTAFYVTIAKDQLETIMALQADQVQHIQFTKEKADREINVIHEERKMRVDNRPTSLLREQMAAIQFLSHPYRRPLIGWASAIASYTPAAARQFYKNYYRASNMMLVVAGDVEPSEVRTLAGKYFGAMQAGDVVPRNWTPEQSLATERTVRFSHPAATQTEVLHYVTVPSIGNSTDKKLLYALDVYSHLLGGDETSLLYRRLVREQKIATAADTYLNNTLRGPGTLEISVTPAPGVTPETVQTAIRAVLREMKSTAPDTGDMARAKTQLSAEVMYAQDGIESLANIIGQLYAMGFNEEEFYRWQESVHAVKSADVLRAATLIADTPMVIGVVTPDADAEGGAGAQ